MFYYCFLFYNRIFLFIYILKEFNKYQEHDENQKADDDLNEMIRPLRYPEFLSLIILFT